MRRYVKGSGHLMLMNEQDGGEGVSSNSNGFCLVVVRIDDVIRQGSLFFNTGRSEKYLKRLESEYNKSELSKHVKFPLKQMSLKKLSKVSKPTTEEKKRLEDAALANNSKPPAAAAPKPPVKAKGKENRPPGATKTKSKSSSSSGKASPTPAKKKSRPTIDLCSP